MPCKKESSDEHGTTKVAAKQEIASQKIPKKIYGCIVESHESSRQRVESSLLTKHEDRCGKAFTSMTHHNLVHNFILVLQAMKILDAKSCSGQGMEKAWGDPSMETGESQREEGEYSGSAKR